MQVIPQSNSWLYQTIRRMQLEALRRSENTRSDEAIKKQIKELEERLPESGTPTTPPPFAIQNMIRNGDHNHSVNTWWETAPSGGNKDKEAANVYAYPPFEPLTVDDGVMTSESMPNELNSASGLFTAAMNGRYAIVEGAGVAGDDLVGVMTYVSAIKVTLSVVCSTSVTGANVRFNLVKLTHTNAKNSAADPNAALKDASHSQMATTGVIKDPDWKKLNGTVRFGSRNQIGYPFGKFDNTGATYVALHQLFAGRILFARLNLVRANQYVKVRGKLFFGIYNNNEAVLDWVKGGAFEVSAIVDGEPVSTVSTQYFIVTETDQNFTLVSQVETVANAPDDTAMAQGARVSLAWNYFAGATVTTIYRKRSGGNVFKMEEIESGANTWTDTNPSTRIDTGSASFPTFANATDAIASYWASAENEFDDLPYDGEPGKYWRPIIVQLPFPPTVNMARLFDPHFIVGLDEAASLLVTDGVNDGSEVIVSASAQFLAFMVGLTVIITGPSGRSHTTTISSVDAADRIRIDEEIDFEDEDMHVEILEGSPRGLMYDLVGVSLNDGEWAFHPEDNSELRGQAVASNPNGSTQGGTGGGDPNGGGTGGVCVVESTLIWVRGESNTDILQVSAADIVTGLIEGKPRPLFWNGLGFDDSDFNEVEWARLAIVRQIVQLQTKTRSLLATATHRIVAGPETYRRGIRLVDLTQGKNVLISDGELTKLEAISSLTRHTGRFSVVSFGLRGVKRTRSLFVTDGIISHNRKNEE